MTCIHSGQCTYCFESHTFSQSINEELCSEDIIHMTPLVFYDLHCYGSHWNHKQPSIHPYCSGYNLYFWKALDGKTTCCKSARFWWFLVKKNTLKDNILCLSRHTYWDKYHHDVLPFYFTRVLFLFNQMMYNSTEFQKLKLSYLYVG